MNKILDKDWTTFSNWERTYKKKFPGPLTAEYAFAIYFDLCKIQNQFPEKEPEKSEKEKLKSL